MEAVRIRGGDERLVEAFGGFHGAPVRIEEGIPEMAQLDRVKAVDPFHQRFSDRPAENVERMRRDRENGLPALPAQCFQVVERAQRRYLLRADIQ